MVGNVSRGVFHHPDPYSVLHRSEMLNAPDGFPALSRMAFRWNVVPVGDAERYVADLHGVPVPILKPARKAS